MLTLTQVAAADITPTPAPSKILSGDNSYSKYVVEPLLSANRGEQVYNVGFVPLRGVAAPHSTVMIAVDGVDAQSVQASKYGAWASDVEIEGLGKHQITLRNIDQSGAALSEVREYEITLVEQPRALPVTGGAASEGVWLGMLLSLIILVILSLRDRRSV